MTLGLDNRLVRGIDNKPEYVRMTRNRVSKRMAKNEKDAQDDGLTAGERATKSLEEAEGKPQKSQKESEDQARKELVPVEELGLAPSKSTGQLVPDTQTGVMAAQAVAPDSQKKTGTIKVVLEGAAAADGEKQEIEVDFFDGGDLPGTFRDLSEQLHAIADEKGRKMDQTVARAMANTTGVTQDNYQNTPEAKGRSGEVFLTDADALKAEVDAQNAKRAESKGEKKSAQAKAAEKQDQPSKREDAADKKAAERKDSDKK